MISSLRTIPVGNINHPDAVKHSESCDEFATRLDFETVLLPGDPGPVISGLRLYCAGQTEPKLVNYLNVKQVFVFPLAQVMGETFATGMTDIRATWNRLTLSSIGYGRLVAGTEVQRQDPNFGAWFQAWEGFGPAFAPGCPLKGVELQVSVAAHGAVLTFDCDPPPPPPPPRPPAPVPSPQPPTTSSTALPTQPATPTNSQTVALLSQPTPTTITVPLTSTITMVGADSMPTLITTVIRPTPFISVIPAGAAITTQTGVSATHVFVVGDPALRDSHAFPLGFVFGLATALLVAGIVIGALLYVRRRPPSKRQEAVVAIEMADMASVPASADVDPPTYVPEPIRVMPRLSSVGDGMPKEQSRKAKNKVDGAEGEELQLPGSSIPDDPRL